MDATRTTSERHTGVMAPVRLRSPIARAVVPVIGGIAVLAAMFGVTWVMAEIATERRSERTPRTGTFVVGRVDDIAATIAERGPILYPDLRDATGSRSIVIAHFGDDPTRGWQVYYAYPVDRDPTCAVTQVPETDDFSDCDGRTIDVRDLAPPSDVRPIVEGRTTLLIDLRSD